MNKLAKQPMPTLRRGDQGDEVILLQEELAASGFAAAAMPTGLYNASTAAAVADFQASRGLGVDGICGPHTWVSLQEARWSLGDRNLYLRHPMLRGDDVAELQLRLGALGFDAGRVDAIFGPNTAAAVEEFQHNTGLTADSVCGATTVAAAKRMAIRVTAATVAAVREREKLQRASRKLTERHIMIGAAGAMTTVAGELATGLRRLGATVTEAYDWTESSQAQKANHLAVDVYVDLVPADIEQCRIAYFSTKGFISPGGERLAELLSQRLPAALATEDVEAKGMRLPILRETRMTAVQCRIGPAGLVQARLTPLARTIEGCLASWATQPT